MCFWAARLMRNAPRRCTPSTVSQSSSVILNSRLSRITPALLTRTAGGPSWPAILPTAASTCSAWLTSAPTARARPPAAVIASTVAAQVWASRSSTATAVQIRPQLPAGQRALVHLVGPVREPQRAGGCPQMRQREVLADPGGTMRLDRPVDHPLGHRRCRHLDRLDLGVRALVAHGVHQ